MPTHLSLPKSISSDNISLPGGLNIGSLVFIRGVVPYGSEGFSISLQSGDEKESDIQFHMKVVIRTRSIIRNSYQNGWQEEERCLPFHPRLFPFVNGRAFSIVLFVHFDHIFVIVNRRLLTRFVHRLKYQDVRCLTLGEGVKYLGVKVFSKARVPYIEKFQSGLKPHNAVQVRGCVNDDASKFVINFQTELNGKNIGMHFCSMIKHQQVILNSFSGEWGASETVHAGCTFSPGQIFDVLFILVEGSFHIYVNGVFLASFLYRIPIENISFLNIHGDVTLMDVADHDSLCEHGSSYIKELPDGLGDNDVISVKGHFPENCDRFSVQLLNGETKDSDRGFYIQPRRDQDVVVLNSNFGGWGREERHPLPKELKEKGPFHLEILIKEDHFVIYINGNKLATYKFRSGLELIKGICVQGQAHFYDIECLENVDNPEVDRIPCPFSPGTFISVIGEPWDKSDGRFSINLQVGEKNNFEAEIALHFNVRFDSRKVLCNSKIQGKWGKEEYCSVDFPFKIKEKYHVLVLVRKDDCRIFLNGRYLMDFGHRFDVSKVDNIMLNGDCDFLEPGCY